MDLESSGGGRHQGRGLFLAASSTSLTRLLVRRLTGRACAYPRRVQLSVRGFLFARFLAMLVWVGFLVAAYFIYSAVAQHIASDLVRWIWNLAVLVGTIWLGFTAQRWALESLDPDGELRRQVREQADERLGVDE